jgi:hypothetical protein
MILRNRILLATFAIAVLFLAPSFIGKQKNQFIEPPLVPVDTNILAPGALLFDQATKRVWAKVIEIDNFYEFPDGSVRPGVLVRTKNGSEWVPGDGLRKFLMEN